MTKALRSIVASIPGPLVRAWIRDAFFLAGLGGMAYGVSLWSYPAAIVFVGACVAGLAYLTAPQATE